MGAAVVTGAATETGAGGGCWGCERERRNFMILYKYTFPELHNLTHSRLGWTFLGFLEEVFVLLLQYFPTR